MSTTTRRHPGPASLDFNPAADPPRGRHLLLIFPWGSRVHPAHDIEGGTAVEPGFAHVDRALLATGLPVNIDHNPKRRVGRIVDADTDDRGMWAVVDLNPDGERVLRDGLGEVSGETIAVDDGPWLLAGVAILTAGTQPAIAGARVVFTRGHHRRVHYVEPVKQLGEQGFLASVAAEADKAGGIIVRNPPKAPAPTQPSTPPRTNAGEDRELLHAFSMQSVTDATARDQRRWQRQQDALRRAEDPDERVKANLLASMTPHAQWPLWTRERRAWEHRRFEDANRSLRIQMEAAARDLAAAQEWLAELADDLAQQAAELNHTAPERTPRWTTRLATRLRPSARSKAADTNPSPPSTPTPANTPAPSDPDHTATPNPA